jgi:hypothetical protein
MDWASCTCKYTSVGPGWLIVERFVDQGWWHETRFVLNRAGDHWVGSHWIGGGHIWNGKGLPRNGGTVAYNPHADDEVDQARLRQFAVKAAAALINPHVVIKDGDIVAN